MKNVKIGITGALVLLLGLLSLPAQATTVAGVNAHIEDMRNQLAGIEFGGRQADKQADRLDSKLSGAQTKNEQAKFCDAVDKLVDFRNKLEEMLIPNRKGELKVADDEENLKAVNDLIADADAAIALERQLDAADGYASC